MRSFLIIIPAYAEDKVIVETASRMQDLTYPKDLFKVVVISDHHTDETNEQLNQLPVQNIIATYDNSSKAKALKLAIKEQTREYDHVVILDADNMVEPNFLEQLNVICENGYEAIQCHRIASPTRQTAVSRLDAISEEINNSIFRKGHINVGLSSALIGSGMCFNYQWFKKNVVHLSTAGEDKELEQRLLQQRIHVHYAEDLYVYDEKVKKSGNFQQQRRRWIAAQFYALSVMMSQISSALKPINWDYLDKTCQQAILPRLINIFLLVVLSFIVTVISPAHGIKWIVMTLCFFTAMYIAVPQYYKNRQTVKALFEIPKLIILTILNMFHLKGAAKKFIHTEHGE
ncbi:MAG: glycosyltransferase [Bacteroidaceae bacterium]|nr:glycosyltransferase [Bacteroidaceae bacterium]